jgi:hypothetical protein
MSIIESHIFLDMYVKFGKFGKGPFYNLFLILEVLGALYKCPALFVSYCFICIHLSLTQLRLEKKS